MFRTTRAFKLFTRFSSSKVMYFDYQATTPVDYRVLDAMMPYMT